MADRPYLTDAEIAERGRRSAIAREDSLKTENEKLRKIIKRALNFVPVRHVSLRRQMARVIGE